MTGPLQILIDTREQRPWLFKGRKVEIIRRGLPTGDYSVDGLEDVVALERKSIPDLVGSLVQGRDRFMREMERLAAFPIRAVVVEGSALDIAQGRYRSQAPPSSVLGSALSIITDYAIPVWWAGSRSEAERAAYWILQRAASRYRGQLLKHRVALKARAS